MRLTYGQVYQKISFIKRRIMHRWFFISFKYFERFHLTSYALGENCVFHAPVKIAGGRGVLQIGESNGFGYYCGPRAGNGSLLIQPRKADSKIIIGKFNSFNNNVTIIANDKITVGNNCRIGDHVAIFDCDFHEIDPAYRGRSHGPASPVTICDNVWLGSRVMVLKGVTIGENSIIGAMSLVTKSIPPNCIAAGNPARIISRL